jgi:hypothetical protein
MRPGSGVELVMVAWAGRYESVTVVMQHESD